MCFETDGILSVFVLVDYESLRRRTRAYMSVARPHMQCQIPRKEVIHRQVPLAMPCYDLLLITDLTVVPKTRMHQELQVLSALLS